MPYIYATRPRFWRNDRISFLGFTRGDILSSLQNLGLVTNIRLRSLHNIFNIYTHIYTHIYIYAYILIYIWIFRCIYTHIYAHICIYVQLLHIYTFLILLVIKSLDPRKIDELFNCPVIWPYITIFVFWPLGKKLYLFQFFFNYIIIKDKTYMKFDPCPKTNRNVGIFWHNISF